MWDLSRCGRMAWTWVLAFGLFLAIFIAVPNIHRCHRGPNHVRACFANQKTIAGAVEMYNLDFNTAITNLDHEVLTTLQENGYLQTVPRDPPGDSEEQGETNYRLCEAGVYCIRHGFIQGGHGRGCRAQLRAFDIHDPDLLQEAHERPPDPPARWRRLHGFDLIVLQLAFVLLVYRLLKALAPFLDAEKSEDLAAWSTRQGRARLAELSRHEERLLDRLVLDVVLAAPPLLMGAYGALNDIRSIPPLGGIVLLLVLLGAVDGVGLARKLRRRHRRLPPPPLHPEDATISGTLLVLTAGLVALNAASSFGGDDRLSLLVILGGLFVQSAVQRGLARRKLMRWHEELEEAIAARARLRGRPTRPVVHELALPPMRLNLESARCPVCGEDFRGTDVALCADCGTPHHPACLAWNGRCATYGCGATRARRIGRGEAVAMG